MEGRKEGRKADLNDNYQVFFFKEIYLYISKEEKGGRKKR
jgi:hypothetical protein